MKTTRLRPALLPALLLLVAAGRPASAGKDVYGDFYKAKRLTTTEDAFHRAEQNLKAVAVGMGELELLEAMKMEVLGNHGKAYDARMDGYLVAASAEANRKAAKGERHLLFGYTADGREVTRIHVTLVGRKVTAVTPTGDGTPLVAAAGDGEAAPEGTH